METTMTPHNEIKSEIAGLDPQSSGNHPRERPWQVRSSEVIYQNDFFRLRRDTCALLENAEVSSELYVLDLPDSVIVVPRNPAGDFILLEQYRHGADQWVIECPGGNLDGDETQESCAFRELLEETGYEASTMLALNSHPQDPSGQSARTYAYLAFGCEHARAQDLHSFESTRVRTFTRDQLWAAIHRGEDFHLPSLAALLQVLAGPSLIAS